MMAHDEFKLVDKILAVVGEILDCAVARLETAEPFTLVALIVLVFGLALSLLLIFS
jgi:hypothetical protein